MSEIRETFCTEHKCNFNCDNDCFATEPTCKIIADSILVVDDSPSIKDVLEVINHMDEETTKVQS